MIRRAGHLAIAVAVLLMGTGLPQYVHLVTAHGPAGGDCCAPIAHDHGCDGHAHHHHDHADPCGEQGETEHEHDHHCDVCDLLLVLVGVPVPATPVIELPLTRDAVAVQADEAIFVAVVGPAHPRGPPLV